jgi:hypothetical protein
MGGQTFDEMAPTFAKKETIPDHSIPVYQALANKIIASLVQD